MSALNLAPTTDAQQAGHLTHAVPWRVTRIQALRFGYRVMFGGALVALLLAMQALNDWVHLLWSVVFPSWGLFMVSGLLLLRVWPRDRALLDAALHDVRGRGLGGATVALIWLLAVGLGPAMLANMLGDTFPVGRASGSTLSALADVARYGFGGPVPNLMAPEGLDQVARGLGSPPRFVTVAMGTSMFAACATITFVALAFLGRMLGDWRMRSAFFLAAPPAIGVTALLPVVGLADGLWRNEPWFVRAYGPLVATALGAAAALLIATAIDLRLGRNGAAPTP